MNNNEYICPICNSNDLILRHEASYVYSYVIDSDAPGLKNSEEFLSYLYDKREQKDSREYIECKNCGTQFPYTFINGVLIGENYLSQSSADYMI
jgi:glutaredoxin